MNSLNLAASVSYAFNSLSFVFVFQEYDIIRAVHDFDERKIGRRDYEELKNTVRWTEEEENAFSAVLSFNKDDYMMTTAAENIG